MIALLFLRLLASVYAYLCAWWLAMLDGVITREERQGIWRALLAPEWVGVGLARRVLAVLLGPGL